MLNSPTPVTAIFFDYDNTLGHTEVIALGESYEVLRGALASKGVTELETSKADFVASSAGRTFREILHEAAADYGVSFDELEVDEWVLEEKNQVIRKLAILCRPTPGANELLESLLLTSLKVAVVSSSAPDRIRHCMEAADQSRFGLKIFSCQASGYLGKAKPHPDIYLLAAESEGVEPAAALAVEDSPSGAVAAIAAGMRVILFSGAEEDSDEDFARRLLFRIEEKIVAVRAHGIVVSDEWRGQVVTCLADLRLVPAVLQALEEGRELPVFMSVLG